jgi:phosphatidylethanolamine/phosphatidyl-N-methylethanolamine N-methyltransferase
MIANDAADSAEGPKAAGRGLWRRLARFVQQGYDDFDRTANFVPSSRFLVDAMIDAAPIAEAKVVVELGPGTGAITSALLKAMRRDAVLCTIECDALMHDELVAHVGDTRLDAVVGDAQDTESIVAARGLTGKVDAVVSSLGLSLLTTEARERIVGATGKVLSPGGVYVQYVYYHARFAVYSPTRGWSRFNARRYLTGRFSSVSRRIVPLNLPPAWVYRCSRPRR